ncbi:hypothetical protein BKP35_12175 [Anaerobacillus arseniciselenatis]|uniref:Uncharacterized protein n=1 Tax=Anaerobacillus arseniciselenatis TaxID=85682 RepID=A0A1S2LHE9_9BACI|nr:hypothetical protein [Anaerobacillus arseniciselenatis]OIJ11493.1 hypothetical protein BKP35_12175 [Anaerobacillus arseniciselenatis]
MAEIKGNFTKLCFSKGGFSCCSFWIYCEIGKGNCYYADNEIDSEAKEYCGCYKRYHTEPIIKKVSKQDDPFADFNEEALDDLFGSFNENLLDHIGQ